MSLFLKFFKFNNINFIKKLFNFKKFFKEKKDLLIRKKLIFNFSTFKFFFFNKVKIFLKNNLSKEKIKKNFKEKTNSFINSYWFSFKKLDSQKNYIFRKNLSSIKLTGGFLLHQGFSYLKAAIFFINCFKKNSII